MSTLRGHLTAFFVLSACAGAATAATNPACPPPTEQEGSHCALKADATLATTLEDWSEEIVRMWRFTRNNGITEGFHRKMKLIQRRAYGFRNFNNYRLRVIAECG